VFRTSRVVRDAENLNQLAARPLPLLFEDGPLGELVIDGDLMAGEIDGGEPGDDVKNDDGNGPKSYSSLIPLNLDSSC
jgi:hypothetical protein